MAALAVSAGCTSSSRDASPTTTSSSSTTTSSTTTVPRDRSPVGEPLVGPDGKEDRTLRVGERRLLSLNLHCGIGPQVRFNDRRWDLSERPLGSVGLDGLSDPPADWPTDDQGVLMYVSLGEDGAIRYSLPDGRVLAVYRPAEVPAEPVICG